MAMCQLRLFVLMARVKSSCSCDESTSRTLPGSCRNDLRENSRNFAKISAHEIGFWSANSRNDVYAKTSLAAKVKVRDRVATAYKRRGSSAAFVSQSIVSSEDTSWIENTYNTMFVVIIFYKLNI